MRLTDKKIYYGATVFCILCLSGLWMLSIAREAATKPHLLSISSAPFTKQLDNGVKTMHTMVYAEAWAPIGTDKAGIENFAGILFDTTLRGEAEKRNTDFVTVEIFMSDSAVKQGKTEVHKEFYFRDKAGWKNITDKLKST